MARLKRERMFVAPGRSGAGVARESNRFAATP